MINHKCYFYGILKRKRQPILYDRKEIKKEILKSETTVLFLWSCYIKDTLREEKHQIFNFRESIAIVQYLMKLYIARGNVAYAGLDFKIW